MRQFVLGMYWRKERFYNYGKYVDVFVMLCGGDDLKGRFSVGQYRAIDLTLFAFMLIIFETIAVSAATRWFPAEPYTVSDYYVTAFFFIRISSRKSFQILVMASGKNADIGAGESVISDGNTT